MTCAICLAEMTRESAVSTPCGHRFHKECIIQAVLQNPACPYCRAIIPDDWFYTNNLLPIINIRSYLSTFARRTRYWTQVEDRLEEPPAVGPMLPSHQRWYNMDIAEETSTRPFPWSPTWIQDRLVEMRIRFNIPPEVRLTARDIVRCENRGIRGQFPAWTPILGLHF